MPTAILLSTIEIIAGAGLVFDIHGSLLFFQLHSFALFISLA